MCLTDLMKRSIVNRLLSFCFAISFTAVKTFLFVASVKRDTEATEMLGYNFKLICFAAILFVIVDIGCGDPDKTGTNPGVTSPTVSSTFPFTSLSGACPNTMVTATFSKAMNPSSINTTTFTLSGPGPTIVGGTIAYNASSNTATFSPSATLGLATPYTATITTGAKDVYGNPLASNFVWTFTTSNTTCQPGPPTVDSVAPVSGSAGICPNSVAVASFSEAMNPATINSTTFMLTGPGTAAVAGAVIYNAATYVATLTPSSNLALHTLYTATITTGVQDLLGNSLTSNYVWSFTTSTIQCQASGIPLASAGNFEVLAGSTVTNTGPTTIAGGNLGLSPGSAVTGFPPGEMIAPAVMDINNPIAAQAEIDLTTAYNYAAGLPGGAVLPGDMSGLTFTPGLYTNSSTVELLTGHVTLDAQGDASAVFIFQIGSTLTTIGSTQIVLAGNAQPQNVFWQVGSSATIGTNSIFQGNIMTLQSITVQTGATVTGRLLARNGAVTMDSNTITLLVE